MKYSKYNYLFESKYGFLLYNSASNAFLKLSENLYALLAAVEKGEIEVNQLDENTTETLCKAKILVENDDVVLYKKRLQYYFNTFDSTNLGLAIAPTTNCNFSCVYCYEGSRKPIYMSVEVENALLQFIKSHKRVEKLNLTWYGGEPLLGFDSIKRLLNGISKIDNLSLSKHTMTTNGYLLTEEKALFFRDYPLDCVQITIDGNKEMHNCRRKLCVGNGETYDTIVNNIDTFISYNPNTRIAIRANLDHTNLETFIEEYNELTERWKGDNVIVYPAFVQDFRSITQEVSEDNFAINGCRDVCLTSSEKLAFFEELHRKFNLKINFTPQYAIGGCGATVLNYYVVGPEGELYKCWNDIGNKEAIVGNVLEDKITNYDLLSRYLAGPSMSDDTKCLACKLYPICDGGCAWNRHKNLFEGAKIDLCSNRAANPQKSFELYYEQINNL